MRGHVRKRRTWEFIVDIGHHPDTGRRRQKSKSGFETRIEAERALREFITYIEGGGEPAPERISVATYLARWLEYQAARGIRARTLESYEGYVRREINPLIGGIELARIKPGHVRWILSSMKRKQLSAATIAQARGVLRTALRQAVEEGLIPINPAAAVKGPKVRRREVHCPTPADLAILLEHSRGTIWEIPILLAAVTGARRSEILGLAWEDVDLKSGTIFIQRGVQRSVNAEAPKVVFTPLKTKRARRHIQLPPFALDRIRAHRREQLERRTRSGERWRDPLDDLGEPVALVCDRGDGFFIFPDTFSKSFKHIALEAGLHPSTRLHDVRHAVATELGRRGVHSIIVSAVLGHASPAFTAATYQHAWQEGPSEAADALEQAFRAARPHVGNPLALASKSASRNR